MQLGQTEPHYIKCIKPNSAKAPGGWSSPLVIDQLRYSGVLEVRLMLLASLIDQRLVKDKPYNSIAFLLQLHFGNPEKYGRELAGQRSEPFDMHTRNYKNSLSLSTWINLWPNAIPVCVEEHRLVFVPHPLLEPPADEAPLRQIEHQWN